jgi:hypothetical protein
MNETEKMLNAALILLTLREEWVEFLRIG